MATATIRHQPAPRQHENARELLRTRVTLSAEEVTQVLGISLPLFYRLTASGELPSIRVGTGGRALRVRCDTLEAWMRQREGAGGKDHEHK